MNHPPPPFVNPQKPTSFTQINKNNKEIIRKQGQTPSKFHTNHPAHYQPPFPSYYSHQLDTPQTKTLIKNTSIINQLDQCVFQNIDIDLKLPKEHPNRFIKQTPASGLFVYNGHTTYASLTKQIKKDTGLFCGMQQKRYGKDHKDNKEWVKLYQKQIRQLKHQNRHLSMTVQKLNKEILEKDQLKKKIQLLEKYLKTQIIINLELQQFMAKITHQNKDPQNKEQQQKKENYFIDIEKKYFELLKAYNSSKPKTNEKDPSTRHQTFQSNIINSTKTHGSQEDDHSNQGGKYKEQNTKAMKIEDEPPKNNNKMNKNSNKDEMSEVPMINFQGLFMGKKYAHTDRC